MKKKRSNEWNRENRKNFACNLYSVKQVCLLDGRTNHVWDKVVVPWFDFRLTPPVCQFFFTLFPFFSTLATDETIAVYILICSCLQFACSVSSSSSRIRCIPLLLPRLWEILSFRICQTRQNGPARKNWCGSNACCVVKVMYHKEINVLIFLYFLF